MLAFATLVMGNFAWGEGYPGTGASYEQCRGLFNFRVPIYDEFSGADDDWLNNAKYKPGYVCSSNY